ncbi:hypothetical protein [Anabaena lutea]|uniref:Uncharacterized protein n=1 Tax=Anabaena lutea FACHB-196 TaxID=2692881 RepID=A0ABR8FJ71_9NOST|nr:hypothetical protein [Anabaena lutea]MBD2570226.1 hypothetical protein [Anabaena lutea FACHB-196]
MGSGIAKRNRKSDERIIQEHLIGRMVVVEGYAFLTHPLPETYPVSRKPLK